MSMRAIILAAGVGQRLGLAGEAGHAAPPKCLLRFPDAKGMTLLERHLRLLKSAGIHEIVIVVGYEHQQIADEIDRIDGLGDVDLQPRPTLVLNPQYTLGSVVSLATAGEWMTDCADDVLVMDADVLYDARMLDALLGAHPAGRPANSETVVATTEHSERHANRLLIDRGFEPGDEPVKLCLRNGQPVELRKQVAAGLEYDTIGESVGFFRFTPASAMRLLEICRAYVADGRGSSPHEEAVRDLLLEQGAQFSAADATGVPWLEIDFPADVARARDVILPHLHPVP